MLFTLNSPLEKFFNFHISSACSSTLPRRTIKRRDWREAETGVRRCCHTSRAPPFHVNVTLLFSAFDIEASEEKLNGFFLFLKPIYSISAFSALFSRRSTIHPRIPRQLFAIVYNSAIVTLRRLILYSHL